MSTWLDKQLFGVYVLLGQTQKRNSKGLGKPSRHREGEQKMMVPELAGRVEMGSWTRDAHYSSSCVLQWALLIGSCHPKGCARKLWMPGVCVPATQEMHGRSPMVPGCSPSQDLPGLSRPLPGSGCAVATGCRQPAKAPASTWAGAFAQGSREAEFIYTPPSTCFLTSAAPL